MCRKLSPEKKIKLSINMTDTCVHICMEGIRNRNPELDEKAVIEKVRERILFRKRVR